MSRPPVGISRQNRVVHLRHHRLIGVRLALSLALILAAAIGWRVTNVLASSHSSLGPSSEEAPTPFQLLPGNVIRDTTAPDVSTIAASVAPILWFAPTELSLQGAAQLPQPLPCDVGPDESVVYYTAEPGAGVIRDYAVETIRFFFYYAQDVGTGCHSNDLETVTIEIAVKCQDGARCVGAIRSVVSDAHGSPHYANELWINDDNSAAVSLPITLLVEANKHATGPDIDGDGRYIRGLDSNCCRDAWGVRDDFWKGGFAASLGVYREHMTAQRSPRDRVGPSLSSETNCPLGCGGKSGLPIRAYQLRKFPEGCVTGSVKYADPPPEPGCKTRPLRTFLIEKGLVPSSATRVERFLAEAWRSSSLSVEDRRVGASFRVLRASSFGYYGLDMSLRTGRETISADYQFFFEPSIARTVDWYAEAGLRNRVDARYAPDGSPISLNRFEPIAEVGGVIRWSQRFDFRIGIGTSRYDRVRVVIGVAHGLAHVPAPW